VELTGGGVVKLGPQVGGRDGGIVFLYPGERSVAYEVG